MRDKHTLRVALLTAFALPAAAQGVAGGTGSETIYFSTDFAENADSGMGVTISTPGNQAATYDDEEVLMVAPDASAPYFATSCFTFAAANAWFGDDDGDGDYTDSIINDIDALYVPSTAPNPPSIFDVYVSTRFFMYGLGTHAALGLPPIQDGDIVRFLPGGYYATFISEALLDSAMNSGSTSIDVNAFTVDESNGDLYWSMAFTETVNGVSVSDGGIVRLPAGNYTPNPDGTVGAVVAGGAEIVLHESEVDAMFTGAGLLNAWDVGGLEIDPAGGFFVSSSTGLVVPNLWMVDEQAAQGPTVVSTANGFGAVVTLNGIRLDNGPALGLAATGFSDLPARNLSAIDYQASPLAGTPLVLDSFPTALATPGTVTLDVGGGQLGSAALVFANLAEGAALGSFTGRTPLNPFFSFLDVPGSYGELYTDDVADPLFLAFSSAPLLIDPQGYGSLTFPVGALPPGFAVSFQAYDLLAGTLSTPVVLVTQ